MEDRDCHQQSAFTMCFNAVTAVVLSTPLLQCYNKQHKRILSFVLD